MVLQSLRLYIGAYFAYFTMQPNQAETGKLKFYAAVTL
jgi:hypothetical protein